MGFIVAGDNWQAVTEAAADLVENTEQTLQQARGVNGFVARQKKHRLEVFADHRLTSQVPNPKSGSYWHRSYQNLHAWQDCRLGVVPARCCKDRVQLKSSLWSLGRRITRTDPTKCCWTITWCRNDAKPWGFARGLMGPVWDAEKTKVWNVAIGLKEMELEHSRLSWLVFGIVLFFSSSKWLPSQKFEGTWTCHHLNCSNLWFWTPGTWDHNPIEETTWSSWEKERSCQVGSLWSHKQYLWAKLVRRIWNFIFCILCWDWFLPPKEVDG